jgi:F-type H+-transporting ATPase subunit gamma
VAEQLGEINARIDGIRQLSAVVSAMRVIAAVRSREANARLPSIRKYADTVGGAIAQALALFSGKVPSAGPSNSARLLIIALCAEQGFVGAFNDRIFNTVKDLADEASNSQTDILVVGSRGLAAAQAHGLEPIKGLPMAGHAEQLTSLANRLADQLFARLEEGAINRVIIVHARPSDGGSSGGVERQTVIPFDFTHFGTVNHTLPPLVNLPVPVLLARLADEYVFAELCEALTLSYAAENEARMQAMISARENVARKLDELNAIARRLRQEQITEELVELASGAASSRSRRVC